MSISRRNFLKIGSISAALVASNCLGLESGVFGQTGSLKDAKILTATDSDLLYSYTVETFERLIGSTFGVSTADFAENAVLVSVTNFSFAKIKGSNKSDSETAENFMLLFQISSAEAQQATYAVSHIKLGQFDLMLVPAKDANNEDFLLAVINRL